jgi:N-acetylmuramic acid 6-phosphate etherase
MVDLRATNSKLKLRTKRIVCDLTDIDEATAEQLLDRCDGELKTAIVAQLLDISPQAARERLERGQQHLRRALED